MCRTLSNRRFFQIRVNIGVAAICLTLLLLVRIGPQSASADTIYMKSGNKISGRVVSQEKIKGRVYILLETEFGGVLKLERGKVIQRVREDDEIDKAYQTELAKMQDTPDEHWRMQAWCKENGASQLRDQMQYHLRRIIELDPSDKKARGLLGYRFMNGRWVLEDKMLAESGYIKKGGKWIPDLQLNVNQQDSSQEQEINARKIALVKWKKYSLGKRPAAQVQQELFDIVDAYAVATIAEDYLAPEADPDVRRLYIDAIGRVPNLPAQNVLVRYAIIDKDPDVRERATTLLLNQKHYDVRVSIAPIAQQLQNSQNAIVRRAGTILGQTKSPAAILPLIDSLVTTHKIVTGGDPRRTEAGFSSDGSTVFNPGGSGPQERIVQVKNDEVLEALRNITGQDFDFNVAAWKQWYIHYHTIIDYDFRRDE